MSEVSLWTTLLLTFKVALVTTFFLILLGTPFAFWISQRKGNKRAFLEAFVSLPLVLPPTVLGFYLLMAMGPEGPLGMMTDFLGIDPLTFTFTGLVVGSFFYSLPFALTPLISAFSDAKLREPLEAATLLGAGPIDRFFSVTLPLCRRQFLMASTLSFAHTVGEFGVILMIGGNIPGVTQLASLSIYDYVETMEYGKAHEISFIMLVLSFVLLALVYKLNRNWELLKGGES